MIVQYEFITTIYDDHDLKRIVSNLLAKQHEGRFLLQACWSNS